MLNEIKNELLNHIVPFWDSLEDKENGGFYGFMDNNLKLDKNAEKGVILHSRILWFYSNCYLTLKDEKYLEKAKGCYQAGGRCIRTTRRVARASRVASRIPSGFGKGGASIPRPLPALEPRPFS